MGKQAEKGEEHRNEWMNGHIYNHEIMFSLIWNEKNIGPKSKMQSNKSKHNLES